MNHKMTFPIMGLFLLAFMTGCMLSTPTLTFVPNGCTYRGLRTILFGKYKVLLADKKANPLSPGLAIVTLQNGKTLADLQAWPSTDLPAWVTVITRHEDFVLSGILTVTLEGRSIWHPGEPIYIVCFERDANHNLMKVGVIGPIGGK
jgi:hypothetical protein